MNLEPYWSFLDRAPLSSYTQKVISEPRTRGAGWTPHQVLALQSRLGPVSSWGYTPVTLEKLDRTQLHAVQQGFRHEWWSGCMGTVHFMLWRFSPLPSSPLAFWRFLTHDFDSDFVAESELRHLSSGNAFRLQHENFELFSLQTDTLFPLRVRWLDQTWQLEAQKTFFSMQANGCLFNKDSMGIKNYKFPGLLAERQDTPQTEFGALEHSWEHGVFPTGLSSSMLLRSFHLLERQTYQQSVWNANWRLSPQRQVHLVWMRQPSGRCRVCVCEADGTVSGLTPDVWSVEGPLESMQMTFGLQNAHHQVSLNIQVVSVTSRVLFKVATCQVTGHWNHEPVVGVGQIEMYDSPPQTLSYHWYESATALLLWILPTLTVVILIIVMVVLGVSRRRSSAFLQHTHRQQKRRLW